MVILDLDEGQELSVVSRSPVVSSPSNALTSWSGFLLEPALNASYQSIFAADRSEGQNQEMEYKS